MSDPLDTVRCVREASDELLLFMLRSRGASDDPERTMQRARNYILSNPQGVGCTGYAKRPGDA
jgi:hypothetical protein